MHTCVYIYIYIMNMYIYIYIYMDSLALGEGSPGRPTWGLAGKTTWGEHVVKRYTFAGPAGCFWKTSSRARGRLGEEAARKTTSARYMFIIIYVYIYIYIYIYLFICNCIA